MNSWGKPLQRSQKKVRRGVIIYYNWPILAQKGFAPCWLLGRIQIKGIGFISQTQRLFNMQSMLSYLLRISWLWELTWNLCLTLWVERVGRCVESWPGALSGNCDPHPHPLELTKAIWEQACFGRVLELLTMPCTETEKDRGLPRFFTQAGFNRAELQVNFEANWGHHQGGE